MQNVEIEILERRAKVAGAPVLVCGNTGDTITFTFDDEWEDTENKTARFVYEENGKICYQDVEFIGTMVEIPPFSNIRSVKVGVFAGALTTTTAAVIHYEASILSASGQEDKNLFEAGQNSVIDTCSPAIVITSDTGKALSIPDSSESVIKALTAYGESVQDGTPTPDSPVEIVNIENPVINIGNQTVTVPYTFRGLKNTTTGQWSARDELRVADGKVEIVRNIKSLTITAENSDSYSFLSGNISGDICRMSSYKNGTKPLFNDMTQDASINYVLCNLFQHYKALQATFGYEGISGTTYTGNIYINISLTRIGLEPDTTVGDAGIRTAFWNWIKDKGCEIDYILAEPVIEDITATEAGQALLALKTNYPTTSVISDIDVNLTYRADTKNYIDNKIAALTALTLEG